MRIGLDVRYLSHNLTGGVHTYVLNLSRMLPLAGPDDEFVFYADEKAAFELTALPSNVLVRRLPWSSALSTVINDRRLPALALRDAVDVVHYPDNYGAGGRLPIVVTLHDALNLFPWHEQWKDLLGKPRRLAAQVYGALATRRAVKRAKRLIAPSESSRRDIAERAGIDPATIDVVPHAAGDPFKPVENPLRLKDIRSAWNLPEHLIVADGIKNPEAIIAAFQDLPHQLKDETAVVFFSRESQPRLPVAAALGSGIRFISRPSDEQLAGLFAVADAFVFPSWIEGFGLPLVEAMRCGTPVISSTRGSIPEVVGEAGLLFDVHDRAALTRHLTAVLESAELRRALRQKSIARAAEFTWKRTAELTLDVYRRAVRQDSSRA